MTLKRELKNCFWFMVGIGVSTLIICFIKKNLS
jgi:hypothetical protein